MFVGKRMIWKSVCARKPIDATKAGLGIRTFDLTKVKNAMMMKEKPVVVSKQNGQ